MTTPHPSARFMPRLAAWLVDVALCAIPAMFVAWALVRVPAVAMVQVSPLGGSPLEMEQHLLEYLKMHLFASLWFSVGLVASYGVLTVVSEAGIHQATPGKRIMGLQVEDMQGRAPTSMQASLRFLAGGLSWASMNIGHAMVVFRADRRALHDLASGLRVVEIPLPDGHPPRELAITVIIVASVVFWALLPGPVPESPIVRKMVEQNLQMVLSPGASPFDPAP